MKLIALACALLALVACAGADGSKVTADEAERLVSDTHVEGDRPRLFVHPEPLRPGDDLRAYADPRDPGPAPTAVLIEAESWLVWVDDDPGARFEHPNRFALVDCATGEVTVSEQRWWPVLNDQPLFIDPYLYEARFGGQAGAGIVCEGNPGKALVINGWTPGEVGEAGFDADTRDMEALFDAAGFETSRYGPKGSEGAAGEATPTNLGAYFDEAAKDLGEGDTLMIFLSGHGSQFDYGDPLTDGVAGHVLEGELRDWIKKLDACVHVIVIIDACRSGSFIDGLREHVDLLLTASNSAKPSYSDLDAFGDEVELNPNDRGGEFSSSVNASLHERLAEAQDVARIAKDAEANAWSFWHAMLSDAFDGALPLDLAASRGWSCPQRVHGNRSKNKVPVVEAPTCVSPDDPGTDPPTPQPDTCAQLPAGPRGGLGEALKFLFDNPSDEAETLACTQGRPLPEADVTLLSTGIETTTATLEVDARWIGTLYMHNFEASLLPLPSELGRDPGIGASPPRPTAFADMLCGDNGDALVLCPVGPATFPADALVFTAVMAGPIPKVPEDWLYQYGFVVDGDGDPSNNYVAPDAFPADFFAGTDTWFVAQSDQFGQWQFRVTGDAGGAMNNVASQARIVIQGHVISLVLPPIHLSDPAPDFRFSAFRHEGDFGSAGDWSGDVNPPVADGLFPFEIP